ncbi:MAG: hypothetical protein KKA54_13505 [Proteobacteria bacterium]|nr:hypothetical protein [Pseudomonadota bacterium]
MTITYSIDHDQGYMVAIASGPIGWEEVRTHLLAAHLEGGLRYRELIDFRAARPIWSSAQAREIAALFTTLGQESALGPTAVVVSSDFAFGMLRMLENMLDGVCIVKPFRDYGDAKQWLRDPRETVT